MVRSRSTTERCVILVSRRPLARESVRRVCFAQNTTYSTGMDPPRAVEAPLEGKHIRLRPVLPRDYEYLYLLATSQAAGFRWRLRGATPSLEFFARQLHDGVLAQFVVDRRSDGSPIGLVVAYNAQLAHGFAWIAIVIDPRIRASGWPLEAGLLFVNYLFQTWNLRKLHVEAPGFNLTQFDRGLSRFMEEEGRLRDQEYYGGRYWDVVLLTLNRVDGSGTDVAELIRDHVLSLAAATAEEEERSTAVS